MAISVADAIDSLRNDLRSALLKAEPDIVFVPGPIEIELSVAFADEVSGGGGIKAYIFELSANTKGSETSAHRVKLSLTVTDASGQPLKLTSTSLPAGLGGNS
jgi:hypothetical protein